MEAVSCLEKNKQNMRSILEDLDEGYIQWDKWLFDNQC